MVWMKNYSIIRALAYYIKKFEFYLKKFSNKMSKINLSMAKNKWYKPVDIIKNIKYALLKEYSITDSSFGIWKADIITTEYEEIAIANTYDDLVKMLKDIIYGNIEDYENGKYKIMKIYPQSHISDYLEDNIVLMIQKKNKNEDISINIKAFGLEKHEFDDLADLFDVPEKYS